MDKFYLEFNSSSENEAFARVAVCAFVSRLNPTVEELEDIKTAVSEAVTNAIIHGYRDREGNVVVQCGIDDRTLTVEITDYGHGIENISQAMEPLYTTLADEERSGMGFAFMEIFMDQLKVESEVGKGTKIKMTKNISKAEVI